MKKNEILKEVKVAIKEVSAAKLEEIDATHKIKEYVPVINAINLALSVWQRFKSINTTELLNSLYDPIVKVSDLVNYIAETYET